MAERQAVKAVNHSPVMELLSASLGGKKKKEGCVGGAILPKWGRAAQPFSTKETRNVPRAEGGERCLGYLSPFPWGARPGGKPQR